MTRWGRRRAERRAALAAQQREREGLLSAADWAITSAREWWPGYGEPEWVTVDDVVARALEDEGLEVTREAAAAMLRERLEYRGKFGLRTDAYLDADGIDQRPEKCVRCSDDAVAFIDSSRPEQGRVCEWHLVAAIERGRDDRAEESDPELPPGCISSVVHESDDAQYLRHKLRGDER